MSSLLAHDLFPGAVFLNDTLDGTFPNHSPNPLTASAREQLAKVVREQHLDCGVIFDGDADRAMFVDEKGDFVQPDYLIPIVARATLVATPPAAGHIPRIIHDVRTSRGAIEAIREMGCEPVMVPVGHAFAKPILREIQPDTTTLVSFLAVILEFWPLYAFWTRSPRPNKKGCRLAK